MKKKKGYVLVYSVIAMLLTCALVLSTVTIILYYGIVASIILPMFDMYSIIG